jgi:hydroxyacylglutathione hydrolase
MLAIVDPRRDVDVYLEYARSRGLQVTHVLETHVHADFASGARELAERTGARLLLSGHDEGQEYEVRFRHEELTDGDAVELGSVRLRALHTPGHSPEHLSFLVFDRGRSEDVPMLLLSGDFLFVGSVGRPDLLGEEAKEGLARTLYRSLREVLDGLPDGLEIHPGHGAGSMCGSGMSGRPVSTLGFERLANPYLDPSLSEAAFVERILGSAPPFPPYYRKMKRLNAVGSPTLEEIPGGTPLSPERVADLVSAGASVVDLRDQHAFGGGHLPGSFGIAAGPKVSTWAAWIVPYDRPIVLVPQHEGQVEAAARALVRVGLDDVRGHLAGGIEGWRAQGRELESLPQITPPELHRRLERGEDVSVLDVRTDAEWRAGHVAGARHVMAGELADRLHEIEGGQDGRPLAVVCGGGYRSTVAASLLLRHGFRQVLNVTGGMGGWQAADLPTVAEG